MNDVERDRDSYPNQHTAGRDVPKTKAIDPWKHRSAGMQCRTCMFFVRKESSVLRTHDVGRCRRHAPTMNGYPVVYDNDWCGDHKLNEEVI